MTQETTQSIAKTVEDQWRARAKTQGFKPNTQAYKKAECEFFIGAMTVLNITHPGPEDRMSSEVPPMWVIGPMSGRNIVEL